MERGYAVVGLGYVGLPVALALADKFDPVIGFDISERRVERLRQGSDVTGEVGEEELRRTRLRITSHPGAPPGGGFIVAPGPPPIDAQRRPDLSPIEGACATIGPRLRKGAVVVF